MVSDVCEGRANAYVNVVVDKILAYVISLYLPTVYVSSK